MKESNKKQTIYGSNLFKRELKVSFMETKNNKLYTAILVVLSGFVTFFAHNFLLSFNGDAVKQTIPYMMNRDTFSLMSLYNVIIYAILFFFMFYNYDVISFTRANKNCWYVLRKMNMNTWKVFAAKYFSIAYKMFATYLGSFIVTFTLGVVFNYKILWGSVFSVFFVGLLPIIYISLMAVFLSMFLDNKADVKICCAITTVLMIILQGVTKYQDVVESVTAMDGMYIVLQTPMFWGYFIGCIGLYVTGVLIGKFESGKYKVRDKKDYGVYWDDEKKAIAKPKTDYKKIVSIVLSTVSVMILIVMIIRFAVLIGSSVIGVMVKDGESDWFGNILYVEETDQLSGYLEKNEYATFKRVENETINIEDVVMFRDKNNNLKVKIVEESFGDGGIIVDIASYSDDQELGEERELIYPSSICGVMKYKNEKLGDMIISSNTTSGKFMLLIIPLFAISFYEYFDELGTRIKKKREAYIENKEIE